MPKKVNKPNHIVDPVSSESTANEVINVDGINLPQVTAEILKKYYDAFLQKGFTTEQAFELTLRWVKYYIGA